MRPKQVEGAEAKYTIIKFLFLVQFLKKMR